MSDSGILVHPGLYQVLLLLGLVLAPNILRMLLQCPDPEAEFLLAFNRYAFFPSSTRSYDSGAHRGPPIWRNRKIIVLVSERTFATNDNYSLHVFQ